MSNKYLSKSCMIAHLKIAVNIPKVVTFLTAPEIEWNIASSKATDPSRYDDVRVNVSENPSDLWCWFEPFVTPKSCGCRHNMNELLCASREQFLFAYPEIDSTKMFIGK